MVIRFQTAFVALFSLLLGCVGQLGDPSSGGLHSVSPGKADNYYSDVAKEFEATCTVPVEMTEEEFNNEAIRKDKAMWRVTAVGLYLTAYLTAKFDGIDINDDGEITEDEIFFHNLGYGDFSAMVRNQSADDLEITGDAENGYNATFTLDMAGPSNLLLQQIPPSADAPQNNDGLTFDLLMPKGETIDPASVPRQTFRDFDPNTYIGELETIKCTARSLPEVNNSFPQFAAFVEDGIYDITLFYGHDYNTERSDLTEAKEAYDKLEVLGFTSPVDKFENLKSDSGPFVRSAKANGKNITIEVRIFHSDMFIDARQQQHDLALSEIVSRDVFFYNGHAGPYFGFYLDEERLATVNYWEFAQAGFTNKQQIVVAQGCQTYSNYADMLYANKEKNEDNLDVITSINYTYGAGTVDLLQNLIMLDADGNHIPTSFYKIVGTLNSDWINYYKDVFYGVMGIDGNPQLHPYANIENIGKECTENSDCGDVYGNICMQATQNAPFRCAAITLSEQACPMGTMYLELAQGNTIQGAACFYSESPF